MQQVRITALSSGSESSWRDAQARLNYPVNVKVGGWKDMQNIRLNGLRTGSFAFLAMCGVIQATQAAPPDRDAFFGDTHIHTMYSFDAFMGNVRTTPDDAYRYAKGEPIDHPAGDTLRISGPPLDFLMVSDHAKYLGVFAAQLDPDAPFYGHPDAQDLVPRNTPLDAIVKRLRELEAEDPEFMGPVVGQYAWQKIIAAAQRHNDPGTFTTFIGYE